MAELTISMSEAVSILQTTLSGNADNVKRVELFDKIKFDLQFLCQNYYQISCNLVLQIFSERSNEV